MNPQFPGWYFDPATGLGEIFQSEEEVPKGWTSNQAEAIAAAQSGALAPPVSGDPSAEPAKPKRGRPRK